MENGCQYCGTHVSLPEQGSLVINRKKTSHGALSLNDSDRYTNENSMIIPYQTLQKLLITVEQLIHHNSTRTRVHILNSETSHPFPVSLGQLYERLLHPHLTQIIMNNQFTSHLQPIVEMKNKSVFGYESLLRAEDPSISPGQLFSYAHRSGLHSMLDQKARRSAVKAKSESLKQGQKIFINFLPSTIYVPEFCLKHTFQLVKEYQIDPGDIVFEVVETEKITNVNHLKSIFDTYKASGMKVALDDVGAGYSTLEMLTHLQPDFLKIDRAYIQNCHKNKEKQDFLYQVMERASRLDIRVLAEGIETNEEWYWLKQLGVDYGQGYLIGKPKAEPEKEFILP